MAVSGFLRGAVWKAGGSLVAVVLLTTAAAQAVTQLAHEEYGLVREFDAAGVSSILVDSAYGRVEVVGRDTDTITVTVHVSDGLERTRHSQEVEGDRLVLRGRCPNFFSNHCEVRYTVEAPPDVALTVRSESRVEVRDIDGDVDVDAGARIDAARLGGDVRLHSSYSRVEAVDLAAAEVDASSLGRVLLTFAESPTDVLAVSHTSDVEVAVPDRGPAYDVDARSQEGGLSLPEISTDPRSARSIVVRALDDVTIRYTD